MQRATHWFRIFIYFLAGALVAGVTLTSIAYLIFSFYFKDKVYPGVTVNNWDTAGLTLGQTKELLDFSTKPTKLADLSIVLSHPAATVSAVASDLNLHPDNLMTARRAFSIGRQTPNPYYNFLQIIAAWQGQINLPLEIAFNQSALDKKIESLAPKINQPAVDAVFQFQSGTGPDGRGRVVAFSPSKDGLAIDQKLLEENLLTRYRELFAGRPAQELIFNIPTKIVPPAIKSSTADDLGIKNLLGRGESYFYDSIPTRVYNIGLGAQKINGSLIKPSEIFSFNNAIGTISAIFGFQKAYVIKEGKTVLDDGGGVCQVSTTLYRAVLNSGLPVIERTAHTYRVGFYEQGGFLPGLDATVFPPSPDFKFKNDTGNYLLIQGAIDYNRAKLTFDIFGTDDGRKTTILGPYILSTSPPPDPIYEDDPALPAGVEKQVDTAHYGAEVYFKRTVTRGQETLINETVKSSFVPWPARYLRGIRTN